MKNCGEPNDGRMFNFSSCTRMGFGMGSLYDWNDGLYDVLAAFVNMYFTSLVIRHGTMMLFQPTDSMNENFCSLTHFLLPYKLNQLTRVCSR